MQLIQSRPVPLLNYINAHSIVGVLLLLSSLSFPFPCHSLCFCCCLCVVFMSFVVLLSFSSSFLFITSSHTSTLITPNSPFASQLLTPHRTSP